MKEVYLNEISIVLHNEDSNIRVIYDDDSILLINQDLDAISIVINENFKSVYDYYSQSFEKTDDMIDVNRFSISIVLHFLYVYNFWMNTYKGKSDSKLHFKEEDFDNPDTFDIIRYYYSEKYPNEWIGKCSSVLRKSPEQVQQHFLSRDKYFNK